MNPVSFESMKVLIDTDCFNTIDGDLVLYLEDLGHRVKIKELASYGIYGAIPHPNSSPLVVNDSEEGVEGATVDDDDKVKDDELATMDRGDADMGFVDVGLQQTQNLNLGEDDQPLLSSSRTETTSFLGNISHYDRREGSLNEVLNGDEDLDSEATIGNSHAEVHSKIWNPNVSSHVKSLGNPTVGNSVFNDNHKEPSLGNTLETDCSDSQLNLEDDFLISPL